MPRRDDIHTIMVVGAGPIVIGQACEFDYSGTQACKALAAEGYRVVLINSNPATIMTDPEYAAATYVEPLTLSAAAKVIEREKPDALLPTVGGQTALNLAVQLAEAGILRENGVRLIGANLGAIRAAEDRRLFRAAMLAEGLPIPRAEVVGTREAAREVAAELGYPVVIRPSFTLGGEGGAIAYNAVEFEEAVARGLDASPIGEVLLEESVLGWKEFELEVMRDLADNVVVICSIENVDPMGVHTGDSITVAPAQTLTDAEYQRLRDMAQAVIRRVGVETGGSNVQFAVNPDDGRVAVIEINPRVSRSSALASKATGFPIAKIAAQLAVGLTLDEIQNDITRETPACFEPTLDYVVVKVPRWNFEKFPGAEDNLTTAMKSVGETMALGRTFGEALQKAMRSLEAGHPGLEVEGADGDDPELIRERLRHANPDRLFYIRLALQSGWSEAEVARATMIDPWFIRQIGELGEVEGKLRAFNAETVPEALLRRAKRAGFGDGQLAALWETSEEEVRRRREAAGVAPVFKAVDTCAAEFEAYTPYYYSTYEEENEAPEGDGRAIMILGAGPNRIGQGIEFDYCCVHAALAFRELAYDVAMVNNNPETVSTDYDTSTRLYFEPLNLEEVLAVVGQERPAGVVVQFGGQTPLKLAGALQAAGVPILGTSPDAIDLAEDRERFGALLGELDIPRPEYGTALSLEEAREAAARVGFPVLVRPSYVLGGRAMAICYDERALAHYVAEAAEVSPDKPILVDRFLEDAFEADVDAVADGTEVYVGAIMQHIEEAGIHSGDSAAVIPPFLIKDVYLETIRDYTRRLALALGVRGLVNIQFAIKGDIVYVLEVNPRASRTVPFVSKATGVPLAKVAARVMAGRTLADQGLSGEGRTRGHFVKECVFPFDRFPGVDTVLGPEMKSTGEVMAGAPTFGLAFGKAQLASGYHVPLRGTAFVSVNDNDKETVIPIARDLAELGFKLVATRGTAARLAREGLDVEPVFKVNEGRPNVADKVVSGEIDLIINTPMGRESFYDDVTVRRAARARGILVVTTLSAARATVEAARVLRAEVPTVQSLQEVHGD
ncbi:MAG: carbamoyl-phosphate synthase large subunit [Candidatus Zixiibacteriota bacterium]